MKKVLLAFLVLLIALTFVLSSVAYAEQNDDYTQDPIYLFISDFTEQFPNRKAGIVVNSPWDSATDGEVSLQAYLRKNLVDWSNGAIAENDVKYKSFNVDGGKGYNIEARLTNSKGSDKQILIGAHYDSVGQGANDNASGVAALLKVLNELSAPANVSKLQCDVVFVLFDDEEDGLFGSQNYVNGMSQVDKENTLVMINMDSIANGDNLYVWCENKHTDLASLIVSKNDKLTEKPYAKGTYNLDNGLGYGYVEIPQYSDHTPFRVAGIPTVLFFSGTYAAEPWNYSESEDLSKNTMNNSSDTLKNLDKNNGAEFVAKINATADAVCLTVLDDKFVSVAEAQRGQLVNLEVLGNSWWARLICGVILVAFIVFVIIYYRKLQKGAILGTAEIKNNKVFSTPDAEDIFSFGDKKSDDGKPPIEDIFTIDKK